jgi:hypothetical protein
LKWGDAESNRRHDILQLIRPESQPIVVNEPPQTTNLRLFIPQPIQRWQNIMKESDRFFFVSDGIRIEVGNLPDQWIVDHDGEVFFPIGSAASIQVSQLYEPLNSRTIRFPDGARIDQFADSPHLIYLCLKIEEMNTESLIIQDVTALGEYEIERLVNT